MKNVVAIWVILALLVVACVGLGYAAGVGNRVTETDTSTRALTNTVQVTTTAISTSTLTSTATLTYTSTATSTAVSASTSISTSTLTVQQTVVSTTTSTVTTEPPIPLADVLVANVTVGGSPRTVAVDPSDGKIYVADGTLLAIISASTFSVIARVSLPSASNDGIAIDPNTGMVFVLVEGGVAEINGSTNAIAGELDVNFGAGSLAYDPSTHVLFGSPESSGNSSLEGVDVRTGALVANVSLGYWADSVAVDPQTNMVAAVGCNMEGLACNSVVSIVNGTSEKLVTQIRLGSPYYPRVAVDPTIGLAFVSGEAQLAAISDTGDVVYDTNPQICGPFDSMAVNPTSDQVLAISLDYNYLMVYNGVTGALVNMYSLNGTPQYVAFNPSNDEVYLTMSGDLIALQNVANTGHVDSSLVGAGQDCLPV